ncbi:hypothetical protein MNBD_PLANCTO02-408 [hydrothermal vent metagenome]|uniref:Uncharacterized protein n=1 Tax=hydrothermal vent metagenome TaxID=652676 RepID=A0A3B1CZA1_9ZZZZ
MCSRKNCTIDSPIVHQYALAQLGDFLELSNSDYKCKKEVEVVAFDTFESSCRSFEDCEL